MRGLKVEPSTMYPMVAAGMLVSLERSALLRPCVSIRALMLSERTPLAMSLTTAMP